MTIARRFTPRTSAPQGEVDRLTHYMPIVVCSDTVSDWERKFCASIIARSRAPRFQPTDKQIGVMRGIVARFQNAMRDDTPLIEGKDANE